MLRKHASTVLMYDVFYGYYRNRVELVKFGTWTSNNASLSMVEAFEDKDQHLRLRGKLIRVSLFEHRPYVTASKENNITVFTGYSKDMLEMLVTNLNLRYVEIEAPPVFGIGINGTYTGLVGILYRKESELVINILAITSSRSTAAHFSGPVSKTFISLCYNRLQPFVPSTTYLMPFELDVWITTLVTAAVLAITISIIIAVSPGSNKYPTASQLVHTKSYRIFTGTTFEEALKYPTGIPSKIIYGALIFAIMFVFYHYTSVFTSFLTLIEIKVPIDNLDDVVHDKDDYRILYVPFTRHQELFQNAHDGLFARVWQKLLSVGEKIPNFNVGLMRMYQGKYILMADGPTVLHLTANNCSVWFGSKVYSSEPVYFTTRLDFPFAKLFTTTFLKVMESGMTNRLIKVNHMNKRPPCAVEKSSERLGLEQTVGLYFLLSIGIGLAISALVIEKFMAKKFKFKVREIDNRIVN
ncbi:hypothetical protein CHUAL_006911 [Chamberlinius hualienensis]